MKVYKRCDQGLPSPSSACKYPTKKYIFHTSVFPSPPLFYVTFIGRLRKIEDFRAKKCVVPCVVGLEPELQEDGAPQAGSSVADATEDVEDDVVAETVVSSGHDDVAQRPYVVARHLRPRILQRFRGQFRRGCVRGRRFSR